MFMGRPGEGAISLYVRVVLRGEGEGGFASTTRLDLSQLLMSSLGPIPQRLVLPTFLTLRRLHQQGKYRGITLTPPAQQCGSINAAVWGAVLRVSSGAIHDAVGPQPRVRHASASVDVLVRVSPKALHAECPPLFRVRHFIRHA